MAYLNKLLAYFRELKNRWASRRHHRSKTAHEKTNPRVGYD
jgi:hypothetical protein